MDLNNEPDNPYINSNQQRYILGMNENIKNESDLKNEPHYVHCWPDTAKHTDPTENAYYYINSPEDKNILVMDEDTSVKHEGVEEVTIYIEAPNSPYHPQLDDSNNDVYMLDRAEAAMHCDASDDAIHMSGVNDLPMSSQSYKGNPEDINHYCPHCLAPGFSFQQLQDHVEQCELKSKSSKAENGIMFLCNTCSMFFSSEIDLENHMKSHNFQNYKCSECRMVLTSEKNLKRHMRVHASDIHNGKGFPCSICGRVLSNRGNLTRHMSTHYEEGDVEFIPGLHACIPCKRNFISKILLIKHMENHKRAPKFMGQNFVCNECGASFVNQGNLGRHMLVHSGEKEYLCPVCDYKATQKANLQRHLQIHRKNEKTVFPCEICGEKYTKITLKMHKLKHKYNNSLMCTKCGKKCNSFVKLDKHMTTHNITKEIPCFFCDRIFTSRADYNKHMDLNHQDKFGTLQSVPNPDSYSVCLKCYKIFNHFCMLKEHMRSHVNDNKFSCSKCTFSCRKKSRLMLHLKSQCDRTGVFKCKTCERVYYNKQHLIRHMVAVHTENKPYECSECEYKTSQVHNLHSHLKKMHYKGTDVICKFDCEECERKFASKAELDRHIHTHKTNKQCHYCDYVSKSNKGMKKHEKMCKIHNEYISCPECRLKFKSYLHLENHIASVHTDEIIASNNATPFFCEYCDRYFSFSHTLKKHILRQHRGKSLLKCEECDFKASTEHRLEIHIAEEHEDTLSFSCSFCKFKTTESSFIKKHIEKEHPDEIDSIEMGLGKKSIYSCPECEERFIDRNLLKKHLISKHL